MTNRGISFALLTTFVLAPIVASADGGVMRARQASGPFLISIFTASDPLRAGPIDVSVLVQGRKSGETTLDATVDLAIQPPRSDSPRFRARATHEQATNKLLQCHDEHACSWTMGPPCRRATGAGRRERHHVTQVAPPAPRLAAIWPYLLLPPFATVVFALHQALRQDALHRAHSGAALLSHGAQN